MTDYVLQKMEQYKIPMTRENYLNIAYFGNPPEQLDAEAEAELPEQFQLRGNSSEEESPEEEAEESPEAEAAEKE